MLGKTRSDARFTPREDMTSSDTVNLCAAKLASWKLARHYPLKNCPSPFLIPVVMIGRDATYEPWVETSCPAIVVRAQDLLVKNGQNTNAIFEQIKSAGGIHRFLGFDGNIILSSIMRDQTILGFSSQTYAAMIHALKPTYYFTSDGETYLEGTYCTPDRKTYYYGGKRLSESEINRVVEYTKYLLKECPESKPIGLIKGCNLDQIETHSEQLLKLDISHFVFHAGDFICRGTRKAIHLATTFAKKMRKLVPWFIIYGSGANSNFSRFGFADGFVTQSHFVNALSYSQKMIAGKWTYVKGSSNRETVMYNLCALEKNLALLSCQVGLTPWLSPEKTTQVLLEKMSNKKQFSAEEAE